MPASKKAAQNKLPKAASAPKGAKLDVVIDGPMLFVPSEAKGSIDRVEVYSPSNGHPVGAIFLPAVWFTDEELNDPRCARWPEAESFLMLDPHSYAVHLTQKKAGKPLAMKAIPNTNHKVKPGRRISSDWDVSINFYGSLGGWDSPRVAEVTEGLFYGSDSPTTSTVALLQRLTYNGVTEVDFSGAPAAAKAYLNENISKGGTLIILGEIYYQPSLMHERKAIDSLAKLAGLDLHLTTREPLPSNVRLMSHLKPCLSSIIVA